MLDGMAGMLMKQMGVNPQQVQGMLQQFMQQHNALVQAINAIRASQDALSAKMTRMESILVHMVPSPDGSTYEEMDPANWIGDQTSVRQLAE